MKSAALVILARLRKIWNLEARLYNMLHCNCEVAI